MKMTCIESSFVKKEENEEFNIAFDNPTLINNHEILQCKNCGMEFMSEIDLRIHSNIHEMGKYPSEMEIHLRRNLLYEEVRKQQDEDLQRSKANPLNNIYKPRRIYKPRSKRVGLTKIKMEDCLRCDACSCIYIDPQDYHKHMRNFHQRYNTVIPRSRRKTNEQFSFTENITEDQKFLLQSEACVNHSINSSSNLNFINDFNIREHIKSRWSKVVSERLMFPVEIKEEPQIDDCTYLLGQVEVNIKTEPLDY